MNRHFSGIYKMVFVLGTFLASFAVIAGAYDDMLNAVSAKDVNRVDRLLQRGMDVNTSDQIGNTLLILAARNSDQTMVELLLKNGANVLKKNQYGDSALMLAALGGNLQSVTVLVSAGAEIDPEGWTPLIYAAFAGHADVVRYLLTKDVDVDAQSENGISALMAASRNGHLEIVDMLLAKDAEIGLVSQDNLTAADMALAAGYSGIVRLLKSNEKH